MPERRSSTSRTKESSRKRTTTRKRRPPQSLARRLLNGLALLALLIGIILALNWAINRGYLDPDRLIAILSGEEPPPAVTVTQSGEIAVYFTTPALVYPDVARDRRPPPHEQALIADLDRATRSIDFVSFEYNLVSIAEALVRAQARGVRVRLALDRESLESPPMSKWAGMIEDARIPIAWEDTDAFLHSKFVIIDQQLLWTGSWNATINDTYRNNNNLLRISIPPLIENYQVEFEQLLAGTRSTAKERLTPNPLVQLNEVGIENYFSPQDRAEQYVVRRLEEAQESIRFLAFSYTSDPIAETMLARAVDGVLVEGVMEKRNAEGSGAEFARLRDGGIAVFEDGNCYTMHHKIIIIDERTVITGSFNFTGRANELNVENLLIIDDPLLAAAYGEEFERVMNQARNPTRCG